MIMPESRTFSFRDLLSPYQLNNQRWLQLAEVIDQLFEEFVYPELERNKNLLSIYTANEEDLEAISIDRFHHLFSSIERTIENKRLSISLQQDIARARNGDEAVYMAIASLGISRDSVEIVKLYSPKKSEYSPENLRELEEISDKNDYFLTSRVGISLDASALFATGLPIYGAEEQIREILNDKIMSEHTPVEFRRHFANKANTISILNNSGAITFSATTMN